MNKPDSAISQTISIVLIVALTVFFAAITGAAVLLNTNATPAAPISGITITENNGFVSFAHYSGEQLKAGEYEIILDSKTIKDTPDFGPGKILKYEAENINHAAIVYTTKGNNAVIAEKYFGGSGVLVKKVDVEVIGFTTSSDRNKDEIGEKIDDNGKYEIIYGTESKIGVIIKLSGEYVGEVKELTDVKVGGITPEELKSSEYPYCYSIPIDENTNKKYHVSGNIIFKDDTVQEFKAENVYIPGESELTFRIDSYAKYKTGVFSSGTNKYVGHGITVEITGGTRKDEAIPIKSTLTGIKVILNDKIVTSEGETDTLEIEKHLIRDDKIEINGETNTGDTKSYYYIKNEEKLRVPLDVIAYIVSINLNGEPKEYTFNRVDESLKDIINFHIPAWSPLYETELFRDPDFYKTTLDEEEKEKYKPVSVNIEPYLSDYKDQHGVKVTVSNGYFPDIEHTGNGKIFPVSIKVTLTSQGGEEIPLAPKDVSSIGNYEYIFIIDNDVKHTEGITNAKVNAVLTMKDTLLSIEPKSITYNEDVNIQGVTSPIDVTVEGYQKAKVTNNNADKGHGIKITAAIKEGAELDKSAIYYLGVTLNNKTTDKTIKYPLSLDKGNYYLNYDTTVKLNGANSNGGNVKINGINYLKVAEKGELTGGDGKKGTSYLYIGKVEYEYNDCPIENAEVKLDLYKDAGNGLKFIKNIYDDTIDIPPRLYSG